MAKKRFNVNTVGIVLVPFLVTFILFFVWQYSLFLEIKNRKIDPYSFNQPKCVFGTSEEVASLDFSAPYGSVRIPIIYHDCKAWLSPLFEAIGL